MRLNLALALAVLVSALYLVHLQHESRQLYVSLGRINAESERLGADQEQLLVLKRLHATPAKVQQVAIEQLQMRPTQSAITEYVNLEPTKKASQP